MEGGALEFRNYYGEPFRIDLNAVTNFPSCPCSEADEAVIQPRTISTQNPVIRSWKPEQLQLFATALFFTVLVDQVCYTHYRDFYPQFQKLTRYPKFHGDCPGGCWWNLHPNRIFRAAGSSPGSPSNWSGRVKIPENTIDVMRNEVLEFFNDYMQAIDGKEFWRRCVGEMPS